MATIKQLKIGNTNYDIKALNATNNNTADFVVRDMKYGTADPSGGSAGQVYLQYSADTTANPYVYAEDAPGDAQSVADKYYTKSEVDAAISSAVATAVAQIDTKYTPVEYTWTGNTASELLKQFRVNGTGWVSVAFYGKCTNGTDNYGLVQTRIEKSTNNGSSWTNMVGMEHRKHGSGYTHWGGASNSTIAMKMNNNDRIRAEAHWSFDGNLEWRVHILAFGGCTITAL